MNLKLTTAALAGLALAIFSLPVLSSIALDDPRLNAAIVIGIQQAGFTQIVIDGYIHKPNVKEVESRLNAGGDFGIVYFNSGGGDLAAAQEIGRLIRNKGYATQIGKLSADYLLIEPAICESACPIAFIGGKYRLLDANTGRLGVHRFVKANQGNFASDSKILFTAERDLRSYIEEMGISLEFFELMMKTPHNHMQHISEKSLFAWNLGTGKETSTWSKGPDGSVSALLETPTEQLTLTFSCSDGAIKASAAIKPWFPPEALLNFDTHTFISDQKQFSIEEVQASYDKDTGSLIFSSELSSDATVSILAAEKIGYRLSLGGAQIEYYRTIKKPKPHSELNQMAAHCDSAL